jgi:undecaprenyl diphosphate synthase
MAEMRDAGIRLRVAGDVSRLPSATKEAVLHVMDETRDGDRLQLTIALNYGSQQELVHACRELALDVAAGKIRPEDIDREALRTHLYTAEIPDPDLVIRTSGEMRLSNFLLWQSAYAELAFSQTLWPDFTPEEFVEILREYQTRSRRFGAVREG